MRLGAKREASEAVATATCSRLGRTGVGWQYKMLSNAISESDDDIKSSSFTAHST